MKVKKSVFMWILVFIFCIFQSACSSSATDFDDNYVYAANIIYDDNDNALLGFQYYDDIIYALSVNDNGQRIVTFNKTGGMDIYKDIDILSDFNDVSDFAFDTSGNIWLLSYNTDSAKYTLNRIDSQGGVSKIELNVSYEYLSGFHISSDDKIIIGFSDYQSEYFSNVLIYDLDGNLLNQMGVNDPLDYFFDLKDKTYVALQNNLGYMIAELDMQNQKVGKNILIDSDTIYSAICSAEQIGKTYCFYNSSGVYAVDSEGKQSLLFSWTDNGYVNPNFLSVFMTKDGDIICCNWNEIVVMERKGLNNEKNSEKVLTVISFSPGDRLRSLVASYNRKQNDIIVQLQDYAVYNTETDPYAGLTKLNTEIIGGNMPDLLDLNGIGMTKYSSVGLLENLYPYLDADPSFSRDDLLEEIVSVIEEDGALYGLASTFTVHTIAARTAAYQNGNWSYQDFTRLLSEKTTKDSPLFNESKESMLERICINTQNKWIDWDAYKVHFDTPEFIQLLQFCNELPMEKDTYEFFSGESDSFLYTTTVGTFYTIQLFEAVWENVTYIGYPESGNAIELDMNLAILATSVNKDESWTFLRTVLDPDRSYQVGKDNDPGFPVNKEAFDLRLQDETTERLDDNGEVIPKFSFGGFNRQVDVFASSQQQSDKVLELIQSADKLVDHNKVVNAIILEEARTYFSGNKTAEQAAEILQNRLSTYIVEQQLKK